MLLLLGHVGCELSELGMSSSSGFELFGLFWLFGVCLGCWFILFVCFRVGFCCGLGGGGRLVFLACGFLFGEVLSFQN